MRSNVYIVKKVKSVSRSPPLPGKAPNPEPELYSNIRGLSSANIRMSVHPKKMKDNRAINLYSATPFY